MSPALTARLSDDVAFPFLLLLVSGGHCQILIVRGVGDYQRLGTTIDDAAGEAFDKTAKILGYGYPGGPAVEATHGKLGFTAPLSAITAAVVGVVLNLALFFAYHVLWPQGFGGSFDGLSAVITIAAAVALFRFKVGVLPLLGACAAVGLIATWLVPLLR